jgi:hypothetical protein
MDMLAESAPPVALLGGAHSGAVAGAPLLLSGAAALLCVECVVAMVSSLASLCRSSPESCHPSICPCHSSPRSSCGAGASAASVVPGARSCDISCSRCVLVGAGSSEVHLPSDRTVSSHTDAQLPCATAHGMAVASWSNILSSLHLCLSVLTDRALLQTLLASFQLLVDALGA